jgi:2-polyprenyl-3-methyl-5-hydroxy-6-metoxy-1,4-benzoquinol methylase
MTRKTSHFQRKEPILEKILQNIRFRKVFPFVKNGYKVLDIGCGYKGALLSLLASNIFEGVGTDVSVSKKTVAKNIKLVSQRYLKLPQNHFDLITCLAVVEHMDNPKTLLAKAYESLKKNGRLLVTTPSPFAKPILEFMAFKLGIISKQEIKDHKKYYDKGEIISLLESVGFKSRNIEIKYFTFGLNTFVIVKK